MHAYVGSTERGWGAHVARGQWPTAHEMEPAGELTLTGRTFAATYVARGRVDYRMSRMPVPVSGEVRVVVLAR